MNPIINHRNENLSEALNYTSRWKKKSFRTERKKKKITMGKGIGKENREARDKRNKMGFVERPRGIKTEILFYSACRLSLRKTEESETHVYEILTLPWNFFFFFFFTQQRKFESLKFSPRSCLRHTSVLSLFCEYNASTILMTLWYFSTSVYLLVYKFPEKHEILRVEGMIVIGFCWLFLM